MIPLAPGARLRIAVLCECPQDKLRARPADELAQPAALTGQPGARRATGAGADPGPAGHTHGVRGRLPSSVVEGVLQRISPPVSAGKGEERP